MALPFVLALLCTGPAGVRCEDRASEQSPGIRSSLNSLIFTRYGGVIAGRIVEASRDNVVIVLPNGFVVKLSYRDIARIEPDTGSVDLRIPPVVHIPLRGGFGIRGDEHVFRGRLYHYDGGFAGLVDALEAADPVDDRHGRTRLRGSIKKALPS